MDIQEMGKVVSEALALRGAMDSLEEEISQMDSAIKTNEREIARLESLRTVTARLVEGRDGKINELDQMSAELQERLTKMEEQKIKLPITPKKGNRVVNL